VSSHYGGSHFASSHHLSSHFGPEIVAPPVEERPGLGGWRKGEEPWREQILREDEELLELLTMFLHVMDD
jgi:hypothetical protein